MRQLRQGEAKRGDQRRYPGSSNTGVCTVGVMHMQKLKRRACKKQSCANTGKPTQLTPPLCARTVQVGGRVASVVGAPVGLRLDDSRVTGQMGALLLTVD